MVKSFHLEIPSSHARYVGPPTDPEPGLHHAIWEMSLPKRRQHQDRRRPLLSTLMAKKARPSPPPRRRADKTKIENLTLYLMNPLNILHCTCLNYAWFILDVGAFSLVCSYDVINMMNSVCFTIYCAESMVSALEMRNELSRKKWSVIKRWRENFRP
jgi:hypothetical protein